MILRFYKKYTRSVFFVILLIILFIGYLLHISLDKDVPLPPDNSLYRNTETPIEIRVSDLMSYMTLDEKIGQMALIEKNSLKDLKDIGVYTLGGMLSGFGGARRQYSLWLETHADFRDPSSKADLGIAIVGKLHTQKDGVIIQTLH